MKEDSSKEFEQALDERYKHVTGSDTLQVTFSGSVPINDGKPMFLVLPYSQWKAHMAELHHKASQELVREGRIAELEAWVKEIPKLYSLPQDNPTIGLKALEERLAKLKGGDQGQYNASEAKVREGN